MKAYLAVALILLLAIVVSGQQPTQVPQALSLDRIYQEIISPLQRENYQLRLQLIALTDRNETLTAENKSLKETVTKAHEKPEK